jgi:hypothetical protein
MAISPARRLRDGRRQALIAASLGLPAVDRVGGVCSAISIRSDCRTTPGPSMP